MSHHGIRPDHLALTRRELLTRCGMGMGALGLGALFGELGLSSASAEVNGASPLAPKAPHFPAKAKRVIHIFLNGGPSHVDTFDPKPSLDKFHGKTLPYELRTERRTGTAFRSPYKFQPYGKSGIEVSEIFARTAENIDDICVIRSMHADVPNHEPSLMLLNCGDARLPRPSMGSWVTYGLGTENQNLPGFIAMCPGGYPIQESQNWQCAFLPGVFQGTYINTAETRIERLIEHISNKQITLPEQRAQLDLLQQLNQRHAAARAREAQLEARIQSFELAYGMQMEAADAFDISKEPEHIRKMYGEGTQARQILTARRLIERGVRFVQLYAGTWDSHDYIERAHGNLVRQVDQPIAALIADLKQRGLLDSTLIVWCGEFGRTPDNGVRGGTAYGRDHNPHAMTLWFAGGGVKAGHTLGATDELGDKAVAHVHHIRDVHVTLLHLLGLDDNKLTYFHGGRFKQLSQFGGQVIRELVA